MKKITGLIIVLTILIMSNTMVFCGSQDDAKHFDIKVSIEGKENYKGIVIGELFFVRIQIRNLTETKFDIGDYFRLLMTNKENPWSQFAMAASGPTNLKASIGNLKYGSGSVSIAASGEDENAIQIQVGNSSIIHDSTKKKTALDMKDWWPRYLPPKSTVSIAWPTFWFSDTKDSPLFLAGPSFSGQKEKYYCWVDIKTNTVREIKGTTKRLKKIIYNESEMVGLRCAAVRWLLECDTKNETLLLPLLQEEKTPEALSYRAMQALMVWGSAKLIDGVFILWEKKRLLPSLDKDMKYYFTWSSRENAKKYEKKVKSGDR